MSAHPDHASAVRVVEVLVDPLHAGMVAEADLLGGNYTGGPFAPAVRLGCATAPIRRVCAWTGIGALRQARPWSLGSSRHASSEYLEHRKQARRLPSVATRSVLPRYAAKFHGLRYAYEMPLVVAKFPHLVLKKVRKSGLYCQPVANEMLICRSFHANSIVYNSVKQG